MDGAPGDAGTFPIGKLPVAALERVLAALPRRDPAVLVGPRVGEDAAVVSLGDRCLVIATDPVTFAADRIGWYAVHVNANDVAVLGAAPRWFFQVLLLPEHGTTTTLVETIVADVVASCDAVGATVCGGHTEITPGLSRPILIGQMIGEVEAARLVRKARLAPGDRILLVRGAAIEGTAILAREAPGALSGRLPEETRDRAARFLETPGISVVKAALAARDAAGVHGMHDPTEGGLAAGLWEMAAAAGVGLRVFGGRIPIYPETRAICGALGLDPLALMASGALLVGVAPEDEDAVISALAAQGEPATPIGEVLPREDGVWIEWGDDRRELRPPDQDEVARVFSRQP